MKRFIPLLVIAALLLGGCGLGPSSGPSDVEMATKVSQLLTGMPTPEGGAVQQTTAAPSATALVVTATLPPTDTPSPEPTATETELVTETPTVETTPAASAEAGMMTATLDGTQTALLATAALTQQAGTPPVPQPSLAATPTVPGTDPRLTLGAPSYTDAMDTGDGWPTGNDDYTRIEFTGGYMRLTGLTGLDSWRLKWFTLKNFYIEMTSSFETCAGTDHYGMILRVPVLHEANKGYLYGITCDGKYSFRKFDGTLGKNGTMIGLTSWTESDAILKGPNQVNRLGVMADGNRFSLYINGVKVREVGDSAYPDGYYGVFVGSDATKDLSIRVDQINYWVR